jgi:hypothetical protein
MDVDTGGRDDVQLDDGAVGQLDALGPEPSGSARTRSGDRKVCGTVALSSAKRPLYQWCSVGPSPGSVIGRVYVTAMDPNDLLTVAWKWQRGDVARHTGGDLAAALGRITAKTFVKPIDQDMFFPVRDCRAEQDLVKGSELRVVNDLLGHLGLFGVAPTSLPQIDQHLGDLLATDV